MASVANKYGYPLNFEWKHPWPRAPIPENENERVAELMKYHILESEQDEKFDKLCRIACKQMKCPIAAISFIDKQKQWFKANNGLTQKQIPRDVSVCAHTIMFPKRALVVEDASLDERFKNNPLVTRASAVRFYAGVPITSPNGFCIGSVFVFDVKSHQNADPRILHKIAAKVLKYMDERLKSLGHPAIANAIDNATATNTSALHSFPLPNQPVPVANGSSQHIPVVADPVKPKVFSPAPDLVPLPKKIVNEQPPGELHQEQSFTAVPRPVMPPAPVATHPVIPPAPVAARPVMPPAPVAPVATPVPVSVADANIGALVRTEKSIAPAQSSSTSLEVGGGQQGMGNMGAMLMNLLARTTETQQQLAAQQGVMFETLGQHSQQLESLGQSMAHLERRFEAARVKNSQRPVKQI
jgi:hypothetical protein